MGQGGEPFGAEPRNWEQSQVTGASLALVKAGVALLSLGLFFAAAPARAEFEMLAFRSPTGNIHCALMKHGKDEFATCEIREFVQTFKTKPADCDLDWGSTFSVEARGRGVLSCHGDTIQSEDSLVLGYGKSVELFGIRCISERTGMTCQNRDGGGFAVSRGRQRIF